MPITIYVLYCSQTARVRYVGMTRKLKKRLGHYRTTGHTRHLQNWITQLGTTPPHRVLAIVEEAVADQVERAVIALYRSRGQADLNYSSGGEAGFTPTDEHRAKLRALRQEEWRTRGLAMHSPEARARSRQALTGVKKPPGFGARFAALNVARAGIPLSPEHRQRMSEAGRGKPCPWAASPEARERARKRWEDPLYRSRMLGHMRRVGVSRKALQVSADKRRGVPLTAEHRWKVSQSLYALNILRRLKAEWPPPA